MHKPPATIIISLFSFSHCNFLIIPILNAYSYNVMLNPPTPHTLPLPLTTSLSTCLQEHAQYKFIGNVLFIDIHDHLKLMLMKKKSILLKFLSLTYMPYHNNDFHSGNTTVMMTR